MNTERLTTSEYATVDRLIEQRGLRGARGLLGLRPHIFSRVRHRQPMREGTILLVRVHLYEILADELEASGWSE